MITTIYASFNDVDAAERAIGALMDHGIRLADVSVVAGERCGNQVVNPTGTTELYDDDEVRESPDEGAVGITTTTPGDASVGAVKGAGIGLGVGVLAALASVFIPGVGIVVGGGALATALAGTAAAVGGGAIAGGVYGYLKDQGVPEDLASAYGDTVSGGGVIISVNFGPEIDRNEVEALLSKYDALNVNRFGAATLR